MAMEKFRYDAESGRGVMIVEDEKSLARLELLRARSNELNRILQAKFEAAGLPYNAWKKTTAEPKDGRVYYPAIMRISLQLRPEYYKSDEAKTVKTRFTSNDDQVTSFLHLRDDDTIQKTRHNRGPAPSEQMSGFLDGLVMEISGFAPWQIENRERMEAMLKQNDLNGVADYFISRLEPPTDPTKRETWGQSLTKYFRQAYLLETPEEAEAYLDNKLNWFQSKEVLRNLAKAIIVVLLDKEAIRIIPVCETVEELKQKLQEHAKRILTLAMKSNPKIPAELEDFVPDAPAYATQTIQKIAKVYKPRIMGWKK